MTPPTGLLEYIQTGGVLALLLLLVTALSTEYWVPGKRYREDVQELKDALAKCQERDERRNIEVYKAVELAEKLTILYAQQRNRDG